MPSSWKFAHVENIGLYLFSLLGLAGVSLGAVYGISLFFPSFFSDTVVIAVLSICSIVLLLSAISFSSIEVARRMEDSSKWKDIKIALSILSVVVLIVSWDYGMNIFGGFRVVPVYSPFISLSVISLIFLTTNEILDTVLGVNSEPDIEELPVEYPKVSPECRRLLKNSVNSDIVQRIMKEYNDRSRKLILKNDFERDLEQAIHSVIEEQVSDNFLASIDASREELKSEVEEHIVHIADETLKEQSANQWFSENQVNIQKLSKRIVFLGELKEKVDDNPEKYLEEISIRLDMNRSGGVNPEYMEEKMKDVSVQTRVEVASLVEAQKRKIQNAETLEHSTKDWYIERIEDNAVLDWG